MQAIRAALGNNIDDGAAITAVFGFIVRQHSQLSYGIDRQNRRGVAKHSCFVDGGIVAKAIVHIRAVEQEIVSPSARAIHREGAKRSRRIADLVRGTGHARIQVNELRVIPAIDRHVGNSIGGERTP